MTEPVLRYGILALASRYDALKDDNAIDLESTFYHNRCLDLLIRALAQPPETYNPIILAAAVISRQYEELDVDNDIQQHHLSGTKNLLCHEAVARFAGSCDVAEAASWVHLRQAIYVCIVASQQMEIPLKTFETFSASGRIMTRRTPIVPSTYLLRSSGNSLLTDQRTPLPPLLVNGP